VSAAPCKVGFLRFAKDGNIVQANLAAAQLFGYALPGELIAEARQRCLVPPLPTRSLFHEGNPVQDSGPVMIEAECHRRDGSAWTCRMALLSPLAAADEPAQVDALLLEDVPRSAEPDAPRARDILDRVLNDLPNPVFVKDEQHRWVILNDSYCRFMGYRRQELLGKSDYDFFPKEEADVFWTKDDCVFRGGGTNENEEKFTDAEGRKHVILTRKTLHTDLSGRHLLLGVITDITQRKQVEEQLRASEERFRHLADSLPQIVWIARPDGAVQHMNGKWSEYTGLPGRNAEEWGWQGQLHPGDLRVYEDLARRAIASGSVFEAEFRLRRHDGVYRWHLGRALPVCGANGEVLHWFGTATDIEDQKRQQETLEEGHRRKNEFLALLGHELRNPLNPIRIAVSLLRRAVVSDPKLQRAQEIIDRQVTQMTRLIDDLLDVSRISRGKILLRKERFDVVELVRTVLGDRKECLEGHGLNIESSLPSSPLTVFGDPARIAQAVGNLLDNAEKFTDSGDTIGVAIERDADGRGVRIVVQDSGIGMSPATLARVFEPFVQAERSMGRGRGGLGLGLSLVKGLAELHHGTVTATSDGEGRGSRFAVWLPLPGETVEKRRETPAPPSSSGGAHRILIIEDNPDAAEALDLVLSTAGHEVVVAHSGEEGIALARSLRPRVVLSDIGLPGMSGYDVARALRKEEALASTYLIAITGYGQEEDQKLAHAAGFSQHLTKPVDAAALERLVASLSDGDLPRP
jgi:PAS domain S-box-containing protein